MEDCTGQDCRVGRAYHHNDGKWPKELTNGIMFFDGLRITKIMWNKYRNMMR